MRMRVYVAVFSLAFVLATVTAAQEEDKVTLEWKLKKGDVLHLEIRQLAKTSVGGMENNQDVCYKQKQEVLEVDDDGVITVKSTYEAVSLKMTGLLESEYDSEKDEEPPDDLFSALLSGFVGKSFTMKMTPRGEVKEVKGMEEIVNEVFEGLEDTEGGDMFSGMTEMIKETFSDDKVKEMIQHSYALFPDTPVAEGDTWETEGSISLSMLGDLKLKNECTLKEIREEEKEAVIEQKSTAEFEPNEDNPTGGMIEFVEAKGGSSIVWSIDRGRMESVETKMRMIMDAAGQEMEMVMTYTTKILPDKKDVPSEDKREEGEKGDGEGEKEKKKKEY
ncbi:MAG: DUF6263 family protein [Planctomycetota bacterium]